MSKMNQQEYIEQRLNDQLNWYDRKSSWNQKWYKRLQVILLVAAAIIPFLSGYISEVPSPDGSLPWVKIAIGLLGVGIAAIAALLGLYNFQENWIKYRTTCESLKKEKFRFLTGVTPYDNDMAFSLLVEQVEALISQENTDWSQQVKNGKDKGASDL